MLVGSYNHKIDSKGRTVLPAKFRGELGSSVVATIGIDRCIALYPVPRWEELLEKLKDLSSFKKKARDFRRVLLSMATEQEIDGAGRILVPQILRDYAGADVEVTLIGAEDHLKFGTRRSGKSTARKFSQISATWRRSLKRYERAHLRNA